MHITVLIIIVDCGVLVIDGRQHLLMSVLSVY